MSNSICRFLFPFLFSAVSLLPPFFATLPPTGVSATLFPLSETLFPLRHCFLLQPQWQQPLSYLRSTPPFVQQPSRLCRPAFLLLPPFVQQTSLLRRPAFLLLPPFVQIDSGDKKMPKELINANPIVYSKQERRVQKIPSGEDEYARDLIDQQEIFDHIRDIRDPEHPYSLEELKVVTEDHIEVNDEQSHIRVTFTPTVEHCSMATVIGLCLRVKLMRSLPTRFKVDIRVAPGSHATEAAVNKQLNDKERVAAALENPALLEMVNECLAPSYE